MKVVIVGGVAGGATAAARIRRINEKAEIILFEKGKYISYANCGLPYYIGGTIADRDKLFVQTPEVFARRLHVDVRIQSEVTAIHPAERTVEVRTATGETYTETYDKLLLSPGSSPVRPPLPGIDLPGIFTLRNVNDTDAIKTYVTERAVKNAVIIGGGFIGLEMAENLHDLGATVSVVEMGNQVMAPVDFSMASLVHQHLTDKGVRLYLQEAVTAFETEGEGVKVIFKSGKQIHADMVLLSIGVRPNTQLAEQAGLTLGAMRGIAVNEYLQTSDEHIYAVGDAIEYQHPITGKPWLNYLAGPANRQARIVADNIVEGNHTTYEGAIGTAIAKVFDLTVATTGLPAKRLKMEGIDYRTVTIHPNSHAGYYPGATPLSIKITFSPDQGKLYGAQIVGIEGVDKRIDEFAWAIKRHNTIYDLMELEHAYAPPYSSAKDPVALAAYAAENILKNKMRPLYWRELRDADLSQVTLVDVRTPIEFQLGAIPGAINIPLDDLRDRMNEIPKDRPVFLYCGIGLRGYLASNILLANDYADVRNLVGGCKIYNTAIKDYTYHPQTGTDAKADQPSAPTFQVHTTPSSVTPTLQVDACGLSCPGPIMKLKNAVDKLQEGERLEIMATDSGFPRDAQAWCHSTGNELVTQSSEAGKYTVVVEKKKEENVRPLPISGADGKTFIMFSDSLDKVLATFVLANGAAATGKKVTIFFTFWGLNAIKKVKKPKVEKDFFGKMFGMMLPSHTGDLSLSKLNMGGMGSRMMRYLMNKKQIDSLESLRAQALANGVEFIACQMSMDVMGIHREELLDQVTVGGVATYMERAEKSNINLFI